MLQQGGNGRVRVARHKTAMKRTRLSKPVSLALADGLLTTETSFFDYGCGHGTDVAFLQAEGLEAAGWDPHFDPAAPRRAADVVNLGYVLNVIERLPERQHVLREAYSLAKSVLVVSVRVEKNPLEREELEDGVLTKHGGFQKFFTQSEFRDYVEAVLGKRPELTDLGVAYVFKDDDAHQRYLANRAFGRRVEYRKDLLDLFEKDDLAREFLAGCRERGRLLRRREFPRFAELAERFQSESRVRRLTLQFLDPDSLAACREERRESILTHLAGSRLRGLQYPKLTVLPEPVQADIRSMWGSYQVAREEAERFLFQIGNSAAVDEACRSAPIGKLLPEDFYVHRSTRDELPAILQLLIAATEMVVGHHEPELYKVARDGRSVSLLWYPDFDKVGHPPLHLSMRVYLPKAAYQFRDYRRSENPPILHRKETLVGKDYPGRDKFERLTRQEEKAGLLVRPSGFRSDWEAQLAAAGRHIAGHRLLRI